MTPRNPHSTEALSAEILADAGRECDEILRRARQESAALLAAAQAEAETIRRERRSAARAEAARRSELALAALPVEEARLRSARIERILENIREEARRRLLAHDFDCRETVIRLAAAAIRQMPGRDFVLKLSFADHAAFGDKLAAEIQQRTGRAVLHLTMVADPSLSDGGVIVQDDDGVRVWDNRLLARLERFWPELRRQIASQTPLGGKNEPEGAP